MLAAGAMHTGSRLNRTQPQPFFTTTPPSFLPLALQTLQIRYSLDSRTRMIEEVCFWFRAIVVSVGDRRILKHHLLTM